jgi:hypothetical protein
MLQILYGVNGNTIDVTNICLSTMNSNNIITIPYDDYERIAYFSDPAPNTDKYVFIIVDSILYKYSSNYFIEINTKDNIITSKVRIQIFYGITDNKVDVTDICNSQLKYDNFIIIPFGDFNRSKYFNDHLYGIEKNVFVVSDEFFYEYNGNTCVKININDNSIFTEKIENSIRNNEIINNKISKLHSKLQIKYGSFDDELAEQKMALQYLTGNEKILEIGGNIGRNSLIIASILENNGKLVTLECDSNVAKLLTENRDLNHLNFNIENSALSSRKLMQKAVPYVPDGNKVLIQTDYETIVGDTLVDGYDWVNTITLAELKSKYNIDFFDTLVLDCEGAFYYILMDMPEILENINLIIMENDYHEISHKEYIDKILRKNDFYVDYVEGDGWGPCENNFFEVWKKHKFLPKK